MTATERLCDFNNYREPSILFNNIRKGKIKLTEASDFQSKFKCELSDTKKVNKTRRNRSILNNIKIHF